MKELDAEAPETLDLVRRIMESEAGSKVATEHGFHVASRACLKLRKSLAALTGADGYRALISRALILARVRAPLLVDVRVDADGSFDIHGESAVHVTGDEAVQAGIYLVAEMLGLLATFIGWPLTLRMVRVSWPGVLGDSPMGRDS